MFLNRAREPYEPNISAAMITPPVNFTPSTDVPVTIGLLLRKEMGIDGLIRHQEFNFNNYL